MATTTPSASCGDNTNQEEEEEKAGSREHHGKNDAADDDENDDDDVWSQLLPEDPLDVGIVYDTYKLQNRDKCACSLPLIPLVRHLEKQKHHAAASCPKCGHPNIAYVRDAMVVKKESSSGDVSGVGGEHDNDNHHRTVVFKYGKHVYELTIPNKHQQPNKKQNENPPRGVGGSSSSSSTNSTSSASSWLSFWIPFLGWYWQQQSSSSLLSAANGSGGGGADNIDITTAQGRIAQVLGMKMNSMKILSKGRVIYPSPPQQQPSSSSSAAAATTTTTSSTAEDDGHMVHENELSNKIIEMSKLSSSTSTTGKVTLLVMGTLAGQELKEMPKQQQQQKQQSSWAAFALQFGHAIIITSWSLAQNIVRIIYSNVVRPVLSLGSSSSSSSNNNNNSQR